MNPAHIERLYGMLMRFEIKEEEYERRVKALMTSGEFFEVHGKIRKSLCRMARKFSKIPEEQEDLIQEACLRVAECKPNQAVEHLEAIAYNAMEAAYRRYLRRSLRRLSKKEEKEIEKRRREILGEINRRHRKGRLDN